MRQVYALLSFFMFLKPCFGVEEIVQIENLWLTQDVHVSAEFLCQDGQYVYFKSLDDCVVATAKMTCAQSLKISPIRFVENIELPDGRKVSQFFEIKTQYDYLRYELDEIRPVKTYLLVESRQITLPVCENTSMRKPKKITLNRKAMKHEIPFFKGLLESGIHILNSPFGIFTPRTLAVLEKGTGPVGDIPSRLRTPYCNSDLDKNDLIELAGGGWSGNGISSVSKIAKWHRSSADLFMLKTKDKDKNNDYHFFCVEGDQGV